MTTSSDEGFLRIAIVDDDKMILTVFSSLIKRSVFRADFFSSPVKALEAIMQNRGRYQLVMSDIRMPGMDGVDFARRVREFLPNLPIIFMTGEPSDEARKAASELGRIVFLEKPFPLESTLKEFIPKFLSGEIK